MRVPNTSANVRKDDMGLEAFFMDTRKINMEKITAEQLSEILRKHDLWLYGKDGGERADLRYADLSYANLSYADLRYADLSYANLSYADLRCADLRYANLSYADLNEINHLWGCVGNMSEIKSIQCDLYEVTYTAEKLQIGCQFHEISDWWNFSDSEISRMDCGALEWWKVWKPILKKIIEASPAKPCVIDEEKQDAEGVSQ